jgi:hypothetical protein
MKRIISALVLLLSFTQVTKAINHDTIPCLELSARIRPSDMAYSTEYSIELWAETELISVMNSEKSEVFRFGLKKNVQYTILVRNNDSVVKTVFVNTKIAANGINKGQKMEVVLGFPGREYNCKEEERPGTGTVDFDYETRSFVYRPEE